MAIPKAVLEAEQRANELMQRTGKPAEAAPVAVEQKAVEAVPTPTPAPVQEEVVNRPAIPDAPEPKDWETRYRTLQGKYNHEVPKLNAELKQIRGELVEATRKIDELKVARVEPQAPAPAVVKPEELEQYGPEFIDLVGRVARSQMPPPAPPAAKPDEDRIGRAEDLARAALQRQFFNDLTTKVPNWEVMNTDPKFLQWLDSVDDLTGVARQKLFDDAYAQLDLHRVAAFFKAFGGDVGAAPVAPPGHVAPTTMRGAPDVPQGKKIWQQREIAQFYNNLRAGRIGPEDAARTELEIFAAQNEGRVR